jgi:beta-glucosidase
MRFLGHGLLTLQACTSAMLFLQIAAAEDSLVFKDPSKPLEMRVNDLLGRLTLEEKIGLIHASSKFSTAGVPRLGVPSLWMSDGPHGVREEIGPDTWNPAGHTDDFSTAMPVGICLAATWNPDLASEDGKTIAQEALARGKNIMLGPGMNIMRTPLNGRNFEYLGEDPYLAARMAVGYIMGEQSQGIASCAKHFLCNDQETQRNSINVEIDDRTLHEIYLPPFKAAVKEAHVWSVMGAYNRFRGTYCCENSELLNTILKSEWGFEGLVMSDWGGSHTTDGSVKGGLDLEMGTNAPYQNNHLANPYLQGIQSGAYTLGSLNEKVSRVLRVMIATHMLDQKPAGSINTRDHQATAQKLAEEGIVLLKNDGSTLPLDASHIGSIAVIGSNATQKQAYGGQSSGIKAFYEVTPLEGLIHQLADRATVTYAPGYRIPRRQRRGQPASAPGEADKDLIRKAVDAAKHADVAVVVVGLNHDYDTEGSDRQDMKLPGLEDELVAAVVDANPRTVVVLQAGSPVELGAWLSKVPSVLLAWYGGSEGGNALGRVLLGNVNPSGKLPCTFPKHLEDTPTSNYHSYPGANGVEKYEEALMVGYRWYDAKNIEPLFPFGFGLSYTKFEYSNPRVSSDLSAAAWAVDLQFDIANSGSRDGSEVAEVFVSPQNPSVSRPPQELKSFKKVALRQGEKQTLTLRLDPSAFAYYDPHSKTWVAEKGSYDVRIGSSSRDIRLHQTLVIPTTMIIKD